MTCDENMIVRMPTATSTSVTNSPKLSPTITPKLAVLPFQSSADAIAAPIRPTMPSPPIGIRSPRPRNASARHARERRQGHARVIGTIASNAELNMCSVIRMQNAKCKLCLLRDKG